MLLAENLLAFPSAGGKPGCTTPSAHCIGEQSPAVCNTEYRNQSYKVYAAYYSSTLKQRHIKFKLQSECSKSSPGSMHQNSFTLGGNAVILFALLSLLWSVCGISFFQLVNEIKNLLLSLQISHVGVQTA